LCAFEASNWQQGDRTLPCLCTTTSDTTGCDTSACRRTRHSPASFSKKCGYCRRHRHASTVLRPAIHSPTGRIAVSGRTYGCQSRKVLSVVFLPKSYAELLRLKPLFDSVWSIFGDRDAEGVGIRFCQAGVELGPSFPQFFLEAMMGPQHLHLRTFPSSSHYTSHVLSSIQSISIVRYLKLHATDPPSNRRLRNTSWTALIHFY
jgi:hypothetical protein